MLNPYPPAYHDTFDRTAFFSSDTGDHKKPPVDKSIYQQRKEPNTPIVPPVGSSSIASTPGNRSDHRFSFQSQVGAVLQWDSDRKNDQRNICERKGVDAKLINQHIGGIDAKHLKREAFELALAIRDMEREKAQSNDSKAIASIEQQIENAKNRLKEIAAVSQKLRRFILKRATKIFEREDIAMNQFQKCLSELEALENENMRSDVKANRRKEIHAKMLALAKLDTRIRNRCEELGLPMKALRERDRTRRKRDHKGAQRTKLLNQERILAANFRPDPDEPVEIEEDSALDDLDRAFQTVEEPFDDLSESPELFYPEANALSRDTLMQQLDAIRALARGAGKVITPELVEESFELGRIPELALAIQRNVAVVRRLAHAMLEDMRTAT